MGSTRGFGVAGALDHAIVRSIAPRAEDAGFSTFWVNDTPTGDGLAALAEVAAVTSRIRLGVGVIPVDRQSAESIASRVAELQLPVERLIVGIGSGGQRTGALALVEAAIVPLHAAGITVLIGALGPKMCALAGSAADGALLNWLTPEYVRITGDIVRRSATDEGRPQPTVAGYVRVALGPDSRTRLGEEGERYGGFRQYAAHFRRMGVAPLETTVWGENRDDLIAGLLPFDAGLDETVVRAITAVEDEPSYRALIEATAPRF